MKRLILKPSSLGDIIHGLQVIASLKAQQPDSHITWVARECFAPLVAHCTAIDRVIVFERQGGMRAQYALWKTLRDTTYDEVWDLQGLLRTGLWTFFSHSPLKLGRPDAREGARFFYDACVDRPPHKPAHALEILLPFLNKTGCAPILSPVPFRTITPSAVLTPLLSSPTPRILLFPNSRRPEKEWPYFQKLAETLLQDTEYTIGWLGNTPFMGTHKRLIDLSGKTSLLDLIECIRYATRVVSNDSGPMHIAAAMGIPTVALFGPTDPRQYGPYPLEKHTVLQASNSDLKTLPIETVAQAVCSLV